MSTSLILDLILASFTFGSFAETQLIGLAGNYYIDGNGALITINTANGTVMTLSPNKDTNLLTDPGLGCYDKINNIYYGIYDNVSSSYTGQGLILKGYRLNNLGKLGSIFTFDLTMFSSSPNPVGAGNACLTDPNNGTLYIVGYDATNKSNELLYKGIYNPNSILNPIEFTPIGTFINANSYDIFTTSTYSPYFSTFDTSRDMIWISNVVISDDLSVDNVYNYLNINPKTGELLQNITIKPNGLSIIGSYYEKLDRIVTIKKKVDNEDVISGLVIQYSNPITLEIDETMDVDLIRDVCVIALSGSTFDQDNGLMYFVTFQPEQGSTDCNTNTDPSNRLIGYLNIVNVNNGNLVGNIMLCSTGFATTPGCPGSLQLLEIQK